MGRPHLTSHRRTRVHCQTLASLAQGSDMPSVHTCGLLREAHWSRTRCTSGTSASGRTHILIHATPREVDFLIPSTIRNFEHFAALRSRLARTARSRACVGPDGMRGLSLCRGSAVARGAVLVGGVLLLLAAVLRPDGDEPWCGKGSNDTDPFCVFGNHIYVVTVCNRTAPRAFAFTYPNSLCAFDKRLRSLRER